MLWTGRSPASARLHGGHLRRGDRIDYASAYRNVSGIVIPTRRRIYAYEGDYIPVMEPLLVAIDMGEIEIS